MFRLVAKSKRTWARRLVVVLAVVVILVGQIGLPVPVRVKKDTSRPFPCMNRACGCHKAEDCWKKCCCFSKSERVAWAKSHGVKVECEIEETPVVASLADADSSRCSHDAKCQRTGSKDCCSKTRKSPSSEQGRWLSWQQFRECRGAPNVWSVGFDSLPPPTVIEVVVMELSQPHSVLAGDVLVSIELDPPVPPPKIG